MKTANKSANRLRSALLEIQKTPKSKGRRYSKQHQAVVKEAFKTGMSLSEVGSLTSIPLITLRSWRTKSFEENFIKIPAPEQSHPAVALASLVIDESLRIELAVSDITSELIQLLKQAV